MLVTISPRISSSTGVGDIQFVKASTSRCSLPYTISNFKQLALTHATYSHLSNVLTIRPVKHIQPGRLARASVKALLLVGIAIFEVEDHIILAFAITVTLIVSRFASIPFSRRRRGFTPYYIVGKNDAVNII